MQACIWFDIVIAAINTRMTILNVALLPARRRSQLLVPKLQRERGGEETRETFESATCEILIPPWVQDIYRKGWMVRVGGRLRALGPHAAVPHSLRVLMRQVHLTLPRPLRTVRPIHPFPAVPSTTSFTWTLPALAFIPWSSLFQPFAYQASPTGQ